MARRIDIDPVTRIEGHARVLVDLDDQDKVSFAGLVVNELRGFERILVGMQADRMPLVTARICGVCPSAHHLVAVKAIENGCQIVIPEAARLQRQLLYMGHFIHSHAASLFALTGPELFFGLGADPAKMNISGLVAAQPDFARKALRLRSLGQKINEAVGGRGIHPVTAVIGGMASDLSEEQRGELARLADEALALVLELTSAVRDLLFQRMEESELLGKGMTQTTAYLGTAADGQIDFYDGELRLVAPDGRLLRSFSCGDYDTLLIERATSWSYMKPVFVAWQGKEGVFRVGPLARLNVVDGLDTERAQAELESFRQRFGHPCHLTYAQLYARLIELIHACEKAVRLAAEPELTGPARQAVRLSSGRCVGHIEAPRGTLFHDYVIDERGIVRKANLLVATQQNFAAINRSIQQAVEGTWQGEVDAKVLNAIEFAIRTYDPCLSCATHAVGQMPMVVELSRSGQPVGRCSREV
ncbi:MAG: Ni/Fe hydrogenase subunit alpha [Deltaproteobacteria bacterium]|nr:MAG: Ni/Fe hydrogenase subunit alpha [Deltaproteobacteria bacterium]